MSLIVTLLTGRRPVLLERTLSSLRAHHKPLIEDGFMLVLHNGGDPETGDVLKRFKDLIDLTVVTQYLLPIGPAVSLLFDHAQEVEGEYLLHLEDDWEATEGDWYGQAARLLDDGTFQVRLRKADERVLPTHMVHKRPLRWTIWPEGYRTSPDAHYTLNPSLIRMENVAQGWPAGSEREAQKKFWKAGYRSVAQLVPGIWSHTGEAQSLRKLVG